MKRLKTAAAVALILTLTGCQSTLTALSVISGGAACSRTERQQQFPEEGAEAQIEVQISIMGRDGPVQLNETANCEYQGSMCGGGSWFQVWYGDQTQFHSVALPYDSTLEFRPHSFCIMIDQFRKACEKGNCLPEDHFTLSLQLGDGWAGQPPELPERWGSMNTRRFSTGVHEISQFGFEVDHFELNLYGYLEKIASNND